MGDGGKAEGEIACKEACGKAADEKSSEVFIEDADCCQGIPDGSSCDGDVEGFFSAGAIGELSDEGRSEKLC